MATSYRAENRIAHHVTSAPMTLVECLTGHFKLKPEEASQLIELGAIYQNKYRIFQNIQMKKGSYVRIHLKPKRFPVDGIDWKKCIVANESDFIVVNKPYDIPVHATLDNHEENVLTQMRKALGGNLYVTQRLDVPVGGLLVFAKTKEFQTKFNRLLSDKAVSKFYSVLTEKEPQQGYHLHYMAPSERSPKEMSFEKKEKWLPCELKIENSNPVVLGKHSFVESRIQLLTGRTHQIRAQFKLLGCPLINDAQYGSPYRLPDSQSIGLFCSEVGWADKRYELKPDYQIS